MRTARYDYDLPPELIAQYPARVRRKCRMLVVERATGSLVHTQFESLPDFLHPGDLLVFNNTRVIPARLLGRKCSTGGKVEIFLLKRIHGRLWEALVRPNARCRPGTEVRCGSPGRLNVIVDDYLAPGKRAVRLIFRGRLEDILNRYGHTPLPPYIDRPDQRSDARDYQTIFARRPGAVAAPTASLHFDRVIMNRLLRAGIKSAEITLHVGEGSFRPIKAEEVGEHQLESEWFSVPARTVRRIADAKRNGRRVVAVGTTVTRTLETVADWNPAPAPTWDQEQHRPRRLDGESHLFIREPFCFALVDALLTNFHLPRSSLLVLVSALAGRELVLRAYAEAVEKKYRFYSYGDCMLIV